MTSALTRRPWSIAVVGGGITGLTAAYTLEREAARRGVPVQITLFEATARLGGKVQTERIDGFLIEHGPDSLLARKVAARRLCEEIGLADQLVASSGDFGSTYVLHRGRLVPLPASTLLVAPVRFWPFVTTPLLSARGKARAALDLLLPRRSDDADETLAAFVTRRLGREVADRIAVPLLASVYGGGKGDLSVLATFPELRRLEQRHRSILLGLRALARARGSSQARPFVTLRDGLGTLVERLHAALHVTTVRCASAVEQIALAEASAASRYRLTLASGETVAADGVILATPADVASRIVAPIAPRAADRLATIGYLPAIVVALAYARDQIAHPLNGTGFLVPSDAQDLLIASTWVSRKWPHASRPDAWLFRCYLGGSDLVQRLTAPDQALVERTHAALAAILGIAGSPILSRVIRWEHGVPRYAPGHPATVDQAVQALAAFPGLILAGAAYRGIGVPDCIEQGRTAAETLLDRLGAAAPTDRSAVGTPAS